MRTAYRCRAYPGPEQQVMLNRTFGCVRVVWNRTLAARQARYATERKSTSYAETDRTLTAMKRERDAINNSTGRDLVVLKASVVDAELAKLDLQLRTVPGPTRIVSPAAYEAGETAGAALAINPEIRRP